MIATFGVPVRVISDRGPQFTATLWHQILERMGVQVAHASSHHPQSDGQTERAIQTFSASLYELSRVSFHRLGRHVYLCFSLPSTMPTAKPQSPHPSELFSAKIRCLQRLRSFGIPLQRRDLVLQAAMRKAADQTQYVDQHYQSLTEVWEFVREHQGKDCRAYEGREKIREGGSIAARSGIWC